MSSHLALEDIDHSRTKTKSPQTNGIVERFHKTVLDEFHRHRPSQEDLRPRSPISRSILIKPSKAGRGRPHQGRWRFGKPLMQTFPTPRVAAGEGENGSPPDHTRDRRNRPLSRRRPSDQVPTTTPHGSSGFLIIRSRLGIGADRYSGFQAFSVGSHHFVGALDADRPRRRKLLSNSLVRSGCDRPTVVLAAPRHQHKDDARDLVGERRRCQD